MGGKDGRLGSSASMAIYDHLKDKKNVRQVEHVLPQRGAQISEEQTAPRRLNWKSSRWKPCCGVEEIFRRNRSLLRTFLFSDRVVVFSEETDLCHDTVKEDLAEINIELTKNFDCLICVKVPQF